MGQAAGMASDPASQAPRLAESTRVEAFSDGVFAIALTLLVLDLHSPDNGTGGFADALLSQWPAYLAYLAAFLNIAAIWINHHELFTLVRQVDARVICANLLLLLVASLFPWPAAVISSAVRDGNHDDQIAATVLYATVGFLVPLAWIVLYRYLSRAPHLLTDPAAAGYARLGVRRSLTSVIVYPAAAALAFAEPLAALAAFAALPLFFIATVVRPLRGDDQPAQAADDP
jgi:uncharacterized membrane protein